MRMSPTISVLMSTYNRACFLDSSIESILKQSYTDFEFIIVNDGSTDETKERLTVWASKDPRITVLHQSQRGLPAALNHACKKAQGRYLARMDDDDIALPRRFETQLRAMAADPACVALGTAVTRIDEQGARLDTVIPYLANEQITAELLKGNGAAIVHPTLLARTAAVKMVGMYQEEYRRGQDLDLFLKLSEVGRLQNLAEVGLLFRIDSRSSSKVSKHSMEYRKQVENQILSFAYQRRGLGPPPEIEYHPSMTQGRWLWTIGHLALAGGNLRIARQYAIKAISSGPLTPDYFRLLVRSSQLGEWLAKFRHRITRKLP